MIHSSVPHSLASGWVELNGVGSVSPRGGAEEVALREPREENVATGQRGAQLGRDWHVWRRVSHEPTANRGSPSKTSAAGLP